MNINPIIATDSYKVSHYKQYPPKTAHIFSYFEPRGMSKRMQAVHDLADGQNEVVFFAGLQYYLREYLKPITQHDIAEAKEIFGAHFGHTEFFNEAGWEHILNKHGGFLPVRVRAVPEGTRVPISNAMLTIENLDPELPWLTNYLETRLSHIWYPVTVATQSYYCRKIILKWLEKNGNPAEIDFKLHDFGYRGVSSEETSAIGGLAHLVNFKGTDTMSALVLGRKHYNCPMAGFSIPAAEHSTITSWSRDGEISAYRNMLTQYPTELVAIVSDSYDIYNACDQIYGVHLRDQIAHRQGTVVIRPDSGDPLEVLPCVLNILGSRFGFSLNDKASRVLPPYLRVIQGDGVDPQAIDAILARLDSMGWSSSNIAFGMGGGLLQQVNRDDLKCAIKCSNITFSDGFERPVFKAPVTDPGKRSKAGRLSLYSDRTKLYTGMADMRSPDVTEVMQTVYEDGFVLVNDSLDVIRDRAKQASPAMV